MDFVANILKDEEQRFQGNLDKLAEKLAHVFILRLKQNMRKNKFNFSLAASTIQSRLSRGKGTTPLIDSGAYISNIVRKKFRVYVQKGIHPKSGTLSFEELSNILEYGRRDKSVPPFPLWRNTFEDCQKEFEEVVEKFINKKS